MSLQKITRRCFVRVGEVPIKRTQSIIAVCSLVLRRGFSIRCAILVIFMIMLTRSLERIFTGIQVLKSPIYVDQMDSISSSFFGFHFLAAGIRDNNTSRSRYILNYIFISPQSELHHQKPLAFLFGLSLLPLSISFILLHSVIIPYTRYFYFNN